MKTIREENIGKSIVRLLKTATGFAGIVLSGSGRSEPRFGEDADELWKELVADLNKVHPDYFGYPGAKIRFLKLFPGGLADPQFRKFERDYKVAARELLVSTVPLDKATSATEEHCGLIAKVFAKTNMLSQFEHARVREVLKSRHGPAFISGAAAMATGCLGPGLKAVSESMKDFGQLSWPAATYLPFLWEPDTQMFLKPEVTKDFADRVGHPFARTYSARLDPEVYESLLDLARETTEEIASLKPVDRIDIQSFIWVVGAYKDSDPEEQRAQLKGKPLPS